MSRADHIVRWSRRNGGGLRRRVAQYLLALLFSFDLPPEVVIGKDVQFWHNCIGSVLHSKVVIEDKAWIFQGVTLGAADAYNGNTPGKNMDGIVIGEGATICAGAAVLCSIGTLRIGKGAVVAANAVVLNSIPDYEIWGGIPAKKIGFNDDYIETFVKGLP